MKVLLVLVFVVGVAMAQRSPYAPRPVGYPEVLNRFKGDEDNLTNRLGADNSTQNQGPLQTPEGSIGDPYLVNRLPEWPREHQPFWYLNQQHIMNHRGQTQPVRGGQATTQQGQGNRQGQTTTQGQVNRQDQANRQGQANRQQFSRQQPGQDTRQQ